MPLCSLKINNNLFQVAGASAGSMAAVALLADLPLGMKLIQSNFLFIKEVNT